jgi:putative phosphoesterase
MKIGLLADAHANVFGLAAALEALRRADATELIFAGDAVGYYPFVNETIDALRAAGVHAVKGNHDAMLAGELPVTAELRVQYALDHAERVIRPDNLQWLIGLPEWLELSFDGIRFSVFHGSPWQPLTEYVYPDHDRFERFESLLPGVVVLGHTHRPLHRVIGPVTVVNPGSCGQPRDGLPGASFSVVDTESGDILLERAAYDARPLETATAKVRNRR